MTYISIKKDTFAYPGFKLEFYKDGEQAGIFARGIVVGKPMLATLVPPEDQQLIYNRNYLQLPVHIQSYHTESILSRKYLDHLPSLNQDKKMGHSAR